MRALERLSSADLNRLRGFLKGVRVRFVHARTDRARPISGLVPDGGGYGFEKDGAPTTVEARTFFFTRAPFTDWDLVRRSTFDKYTTSVCSSRDYSVCASGATISFRRSSASWSRDSCTARRSPRSSAPTFSNSRRNGRTTSSRPSKPLLQDRFVLIRADY